MLCPCTSSRTLHATNVRTQDVQRGYRGETPGALTYSERLARRWLHGARYGAYEMGDRYLRASSLEPGISSEYLVGKGRGRMKMATTDCGVCNSGQLWSFRVAIKVQ